MIYRLATCHRVISPDPTLEVYVKRTEDYEMYEDCDGCLPYHPLLASTIDDKDPMWMSVVYIADGLAITYNTKRALQIYTSMLRKRHGLSPRKRGERYTHDDVTWVDAHIREWGMEHVDEIRAQVAQYPTYHPAPDSNYY